MTDNVHGYYLEDLVVGQSAELVKIISSDDIVLFAQVSGDNNPVHLDESYAKTTMFGQRIAHGMLSASYISAVFGTILPGPGCIYLSQNLKFKAPVKIGDSVTTRVVITDIVPEKRRVTFLTECLVCDKVVLTGEAVLMVDSRL